MDNIGIGQEMPNGFSEHQRESSRNGSYSASASEPKNTGSSADNGAFDSVLQFARELQGKLKDAPYAVPIAAAGAGFVLGVFASSKILRHIAMLAGARALHAAIQAAPTDELLDIAKRAIVDSVRASRFVNKAA